jgi:hypothetical protein
MGRVGSDHIILLFFLTRPEPNPIKFGSKNLNPYPTRRVTVQPDPIYVKLLNILYNFK